MKNILNAHGWVFKKSCHCNGAYTETYRRDGATIKIKNNTWSLIVGDKYYEGTAQDLQDRLDEIGL